MSWARDTPSSYGGAGSSSVDHLVRRLSALEEQVAGLGRTEKLIVDERNARVVVESDMDLHIKRLDQHVRIQPPPPPRPSRPPRRRAAAQPCCCRLTPPLSRAVVG